MNTPYIKQVDANGIVTNPITKEQPFLTVNSNRSRENRRANKPRFFGNHKGVSITTTKQYAYFRMVQIIGKKRIEHYILK